MTDQQRWQAVLHSDKTKDGAFFYAVRSTGIFCRPSCRSKPPLRENIRFFSNAQQAMESCYRPCKRCRPYLLAYAPVRELAQLAKQLMDDNVGLAETMRELGVTPGHLAEVFRSQYGVTPAAYMNHLRLKTARKFLEDTPIPIIEVAALAGYESLSAFYRFFRQHTGMTPAAYRKQCTQHPGKLEAKQ